MEFYKDTLLNVGASAAGSALTRSRWVTNPVFVALRDQRLLGARVDHLHTIDAGELEAHGLSAFA